MLGTRPGEIPGVKEADEVGNDLFLTECLPLDLLVALELDKCPLNGSLCFW